MKIHKIKFIFICLLFSLLMIFNSSAQNNNILKLKSPKPVNIKISAVIVDQDGHPIESASIVTGEGNALLTTNSKGEFSAKVKPNATIIIEAFGYTPVTYKLAEGVFPSNIILHETELFASNDALVSRADGSEVFQRDLVGAVSQISGRELQKYPDLVVTNSLQGKAAGLVIQNNVSGLGNNTPSVFIRGLHTNGNNTALVIVDGIERPLEDLLPEEIEKIEVLKDATSKVLYGSRAANGVLWVTTRRGENNRRSLKVTTEAGSSFTTRMPEYLNSYDYAKLYNEARVNDGLVPFYNQTQLDGYKNSKGANDLLYPDVDYYNQFLNSTAGYKKAVMELNGGDNKIKYAVVAGYTSSDGLEKEATKTKLNRINLRANLDVNINPYLSAVLGVSGRMEIRNWGAKDGGQTFSAISTHRPNEYPFTISPSDIGIPADSSGLPLFGASIRQATNLYADMMYGGKTDDRYTNNQTNLGLNFNLDQISKGLKASAFVTFDNYDYYREDQINVNATYAVNTYQTSLGVLDTLYTQMMKYAPKTNKTRENAETSRSIGTRGNISYDTQFGLNNINAMLAYRYNKYETKGSEQDLKNTNTTARLSYSFDKKYNIEFDGAIMGSNRFTKNNKLFFSPTIGASWILSNENFIKNANPINFLKLKASYGILGYDRNTDFLLYQQAWTNGTNVQFGEANNGVDKPQTKFIRAASPDMKWEQSAEFNLGVEGLFFKNRLRSEVNYFSEKRTNIIGFKSDSYSDNLGSYVYPTNFGCVTNHGLEGFISWSDKIDNLAFTIGGNFIYSKNKLLDWNDMAPNTESYRSPIGKPTDAMFGLQDIGLFGKNIELQGHPFQTYGPYTNGDIAYSDLNNDGLIDDRDKKVDGNSYPRTTFGIDINIQYLGWALFASGYAEIGVDTWSTNNYYWNKGEDKYSVKALDRYDPVNNPDGNYPRLTTTTGENNFRNSSFWLLDTRFFRLKNVELSYTFTNSSPTAAAKQVKLFARGTNLFVLSPVKDLDPELLDGGVTNYPLLRTLTGGISFSF